MKLYRCICIVFPVPPEAVQDVALQPTFRVSQLLSACACFTGSAATVGHCSTALPSAFACPAMLSNLVYVQDHSKLHLTIAGFILASCCRMSRSHEQFLAHFCVACMSDVCDWLWRFILCAFRGASVNSHWK